MASGKGKGPAEHGEDSPREGPVSPRQGGGEEGAEDFFVVEEGAEGGEGSADAESRILVQDIDDNGLEWESEMWSEISRRKDGLMKHSWEKGFLSLRRNYLVVFRDPDASQPPLDIIVLDGEKGSVQGLPDKPKQFRVDVGKETHLFQAATEAQATQWVEAVAEKFATFVPWEEESDDILGDLKSEQFSVRVCTYNVTHGMCVPMTNDKEERAIVSALRTCNADVVLLQETTQAWRNYFTSHGILDEFPFHQFVMYHVPEGVQRPAAGGMAILSRFPITEHKVLRSPCNWYPAFMALIETPTLDFCVLNVHLRPSAIGSALPLPHSFGSGKKDRMKEAEWYAAHLPRDMPTVVGGDFSEGESGGAVRLFSDTMKMRSVLAEYDAKADTYRFKIPQSEIQIHSLNSRHDHLLYRGMRCVGGKVVSKGESQHYPVVGQFCKFSSLLDSVDDLFLDENYELPDYDPEALKEAARKTTTGKEQPPPKDLLTMQSLAI